MRRLGWLIGPLWLAGGAAAVQDLPGDPAAGAELAREVCAACHVVSEEQLIDPAIGPRRSRSPSIPRPPRSACAPTCWR